MPLRIEPRPYYPATLRPPRRNPARCNRTPQANRSTKPRRGSSSTLRATPELGHGRCGVVTDAAGAYLLREHALLKGQLACAQADRRIEPRLAPGRAAKTAGRSAADAVAARSPQC